MRLSEVVQVVRRAQPALRMYLRAYSYAGMRRDIPQDAHCQENRTSSVDFPGTSPILVYHSGVARKESRNTPRLVRTTEKTHQRLQVAAQALGLHLGEVADRGLDALERELGISFIAEQKEEAKAS